MLKWSSSRRLPGGSILVSDYADAHRVLVTRAESFVHESGFFRVGGVPLRPDEIRIMRRSLTAVLSGPPTGEWERERIEPTLASSRIRLQSWGHHMIHAYFIEALVGDRGAALRDSVEDYVTHSVIPDDIRGRRFFRYRSVNRIRRRLSEVLGTAKPHPEPRDLVDIVKLVPRLDAAEQAEVFQRLVLSVVGFTGAALEWSLLHAANARDAIESVQSHVLETLRVTPPAWRLARTPAEQVPLEHETADSGQEVLINLHAIHNAPEVWDNPTQFCPARWQDGVAAPREYLPFGRGRSACPGQMPAMAAVSSITQYIVARYELKAATRGTPMVRTLLAPPRGELTLRAR